MKKRIGKKYPNKRENVWYYATQQLLSVVGINCEKTNCGYLMTTSEWFKRRYFKAWESKKEWALNKLKDEIADFLQDRKLLPEN